MRKQLCLATTVSQHYGFSRCDIKFNLLQRIQTVLLNNGSFHTHLLQPNNRTLALIQPDVITNPVTVLIPSQQMRFARKKGEVKQKNFINENFPLY